MKNYLQKLRPYVTKIGGTLLGIAFFVGGSIGLCFFIYQGIEMIGAYKWNTAPAQISDSHIEVTRTGRGGTQYLAQVKYEFSADGKTYTGDTLSLPIFREYKENVVKAQLDSYPIGAQVAVYYDAQNPNHSALIRPFFNWPYLLSFIPLTVIFILMGFFMFKASLHL